MKKIILTAMLVFVCTSFVVPYAQWARSYGIRFYENANAIHQTSDGGFIVAGATNSIPAEYGLNKIWILKLDSFGYIDWQKIYGGSVWEEPYSVQQISDGGYIVTGSTNLGAGEEDFWVLKLTETGDIEWQKTYGGPEEDVPYSIQQTTDNGFIVTGNTESFGDGEDDLWLLKLSSNGDIEWQKTYGGKRKDFAYCVRQTIDGGFIVAGTTSSFGEGKDDFWVLKLSSNGDTEWQKTYGTITWDSASFIQQTTDGGYIVAGHILFETGEDDFWILKLFSNGEIEWQKTYGESFSDRPRCIQQTRDGGYIVAGKTHSFGGGEADFWILKLFVNGDIEWQKTYGETDFDDAHYIQEMADGSYIVAGITFFGVNDSDILILALSSNGDISQDCGFIKNSTAIVTDTFVFPKETNVIPRNTNVTSHSSTTFPYDVTTIENLICGRGGEKKGMKRR